MSLNTRITKLEHEIGVGQECPNHSIILEPWGNGEPPTCSRCGRSVNEPVPWSGKRLHIIWSGGEL